MSIAYVGDERSGLWTSRSALYPLCTERLVIILEQQAFVLFSGEDVCKVSVCFMVTLL